MAYQPIAQTVPQYMDANGDPYSGAVLKAYNAGTSTVLPMATSSTGGTTANYFALNASGYPVSSGNIIIPHVNTAYKLSLYPTQTAADANTGAIWTIDNLPIDQSIVAEVESYPDITTAYQLPKYRAALGKVAAGTANAKILFVGDSVTLGYASNGGASGDMRPLSYPDQFKNMLNSSGVRAQSNSWMGDGNSPPNYSSTYDSRITIGGSWSREFVGTGGAFFKATTNTNSLSFLPTESVDTFDVYYLSYTGGGVLSMDINGGAPTTQSTNAASLIRKATITGTLGSNTLNLKWSSGSAVYVLGVDSYDSSKKWVSCINAGWWGSATSTWNSMLTAGSSPNSISEIGADLVVICLGINDWEGGVDITDYENYMQTIITKSLVASDVVLVTPPPSSTAYASVAVQQTYIDVLSALAVTNDIPIIDLWGRLSPQTTPYAEGMYYEGIHPNGAGYADMALHVFERIGATGKGITNDVGDTPSFTTLAVGAATPNASAVAEFASTTKGMLVPRMTTTQMNAISSPAEGLIIYNSTTDAFYGYQASAWTRFSPNITTTQTASASASITQALDFTTNIAYEVYISNLVPASEPADFIVKLTDDGSTYDAATTFRGRVSDAGAGTANNATGFIFENQDSDAAPAAKLFMRISQPLITSDALIEYSGAFKNNSGTYFGVSGELHFSYAAVVTGVQFTYDNGGVVNLTTGTFIFRPIPR